MFNFIKNFAKEVFSTFCLLVIIIIACLIIGTAIDYLVAILVSVGGVFLMAIVMLILMATLITLIGR